MKKFINFTNRKMFDRIWSDVSVSELQKKSPQFLCTISGGQDSIVNFFIVLSLLYFQKQKKLKILYCQHFWQIKNFFLAFFVFRISFVFQIPFFLVLSENSFLNENRSRGWRKKNFYRICQLEKISNFFTGHTETDNFEKNLNNIFRGTSTKGVTDLNILNYQKSQSILFSLLIFKCWHCGKFFPFSRQIYLFFYYKNNSQITPIPVFFTRSNSFSFFELKKREYRDFIFDSKIFPYKNTRIRKKKSEFNLYYQSVSFCFYSKTLNQKINFQKPLQRIRRSTISEFITFFKLPLLVDLTNYSSKFSRNKIRYEIIPFIRSRYHKKVESLMQNFFQTVGIENKDIERQTIEFFFLYKILPLNYFQKSNLSGNTFFRVILERSFLQKIIRDYQNQDLMFSQLSEIQAQIF